MADILQEECFMRRGGLPVKEGYVRAGILDSRAHIFTEAFLVAFTYYIIRFKFFLLTEETNRLQHTVKQNRNSAE